MTWPYDRDGKDTQKIPFSVPRFQTELRPRRTISRDQTSISVVYIGHKLSTEPSFVVYARTEHCQSHCRRCVVLMDWAKFDSDVKACFGQYLLNK